MANDEALLHPLIRQGLPTARQRIKFYKENGLITQEDGMISLGKLAERQCKDFANRHAQQKRERLITTVQRIIETVKKGEE